MLEKRLVVGFPRHQTFRSLVVIYREDDRAEDAENFARKIREALAGSWLKIDVSTFKVRVDPGKDLWQEAEKASEEYYEFLSGLGAASPPPEVEGLVRAWIYRRMGVDRLPAVVLDDKVISKGRLPSVEAVTKELGLSGAEGSQKTVLKSEAPLQATETERVSTTIAEPQLTIPEAKAEAAETPTATQSSAELPIQSGVTPPGSADFDGETKERIKQTLLKTGFVGPESCTNCIYYSEDQQRCGFLHVPVANTQKPVCRMKFD